MRYAILIPTTRKGNKMKTATLQEVREMTKQEFKEFTGNLMTACNQCEEYTLAHKEGSKFNCLNCGYSWTVIGK